MAEFEGVYPAIITPRTSEGDLNEEAFRQVIEFNIQTGVDGFWTAGGTGESVLLEDGVNNRIAEIAADQSHGRAKIIMHVGAPNTRRAARMAEHAARAGVDAICAVPPFFYAPTDEGVVEYYRVVGAAADLPLFVYNLPQSTGLEITPPMMLKIQQGVPQLKGLKHSAPSVENVRIFAEMGLECLIGNAQLMLPALTIGATGCIDCPLNIAPEIWVEIRDAYNSGDWARAIEAQKRGVKVAAIVNEFDFIATAKVIISERIGMDCGDPFPPNLPMTPEDKAQVLAKATDIGLIKQAVA